MVGVCYDGVEGVLYLCLFSTLAACAFTVMLCAIPRAWRQIACRSVRSLRVCLSALISSSCSRRYAAPRTEWANQSVCLCVCVCVCLCVCMCVNIFHNCTGEARCSATNTNSLVRASEYLRLTSTRRLIFDAHIVSEMKMKICHPQNISGASEESSTAGFSLTTEADNTYSSSGVALVHSAFCSCSKDFSVNKVKINLGSQSCWRLWRAARSHFYLFLSLLSPSTSVV